MQQLTRTEILHILMNNLINICSFWEYHYSKWRRWSRVHRILCWIKIGLTLVEKDGLEFWQPQHWCSVHSKHRNFAHHPEDQFDQYMVILRISPFAMTALISHTSNTMLDRNQAQNGGAWWFGISVATALVMQQSTASSEILHTILMTNLINICSFWEYRYSEWWHWSREPRILCWIKIGLKLVEKDDGLEFLQPQHWCSVHSKHRKFTHHPDDQFDQYMFILRMSTIAMTALISRMSNTMLDRNQP